VTDERGYPLPNVRIVATGSREVDCAARSIAAGSSQAGALLLPSSAAQGSVGVTTTNEKGEYRVAGLMPGSYYICASSDERWPAAVGTAAVRSYPTTYFPGVAAADATPVAVEIEQLRDGVDFALRPVTSAAR
jgi:hypothetical protein